MTAGGIDMGHHVHFPRGLPGPVRCLATLEPDTGGNAGVGAEQIDPAVPCENVVYQRDDRGLIRDIGFDRAGPLPQFGRNLRGVIQAAIGHNHRGRTVGDEPTSESGTDAAAAAGDDDD
jgi:hypothetical protein